MASETSELILKFTAQGSGDVAAAQENVKKLGAETEAAGKRLDAMGRGISGAAKGAKEAGTDFAALQGKIQSGLSDPLGTATGALSRFTASLGPVGVAAGAAAIGIGVVAKSIFDLVLAQGRVAEESVNFSDRLGVSVGRAEQLQAALRIAGVNSGALEGAVRTLSTALEDPAGAGEKTVRSLRELGVVTSTLKGEQLELGPVLESVLRRLSMISSDSERIAAAQKTLGRAASVELLPFIKSLEDIESLIGKVGSGLDEDLTRSLAAVDDKAGALSEKFDVLKKQLLAPFVAPVGSFLDWMLNGGVRDPTVKVRENLDNNFKAPSSPLLGIRVVTPELKIEQDYLRGTSRGIQKQIAKMQADLASEEAKLFALGADAATKTAASLRAKQLGAEIDELQKKLQDFGKTAKETLKYLTIGDTLQFPVLQPFTKVQRPAGLDRQVRIVDAIAERQEIEQISRESYEKINAEARIADGKAFNERFKKWVDELDKEAQAAADYAKKLADIELAGAIRLIELGDNEYQNAVRVREVRQAAAQDDIEFRQAQLDFQVTIAALEKQRIEKYQEQARGVYRSLRQGGTSGLGAFIRGQGDQLAEQIFVNVAGKTFSQFGAKLGGVGAASGLPDWLLKGTLLDPANEQHVATVDNTSATRENTAALRSMGIGGGGFSFGGAGDAGIADLPLLGLSGGKYGTPGSFNSASKFAKIAGYGSAIAGGAFGVASGVREGGLGGGLTAAGAGAGAVGTILSLAGVTGPAAPILLGIGVGLSVIKAFLPDAAKTFYSEQEKLLASRQFTAPSEMTRGLDFATGGTPIEANFRGQSRVIVNHVITLNVNALDSQSILDRSEDIAAAVGAATAGGNLPMTAAINQTVFGAG